jgi:rhamnosyl/mannosyltransferase
MESHLKALCEELSDKVDLQVTVANTSRRSDHSIVNGINITRLATLFSVSAAPVCFGLIDNIRSARADIVHMHLPNPIAMCALLASRLRVRLVASWHSDIVRQKILNRVFEPIQHKFLGRCGAVVATSPMYVESSPMLSAYEARCKVIPYGIHAESFQIIDRAAVARIRARYGKRIVLTVGRLVYYKGIEYLIRAIKEVDANLIVIGNGPLLGRLGREAQIHGVADRVFFLGTTQETLPYYHACDVFVLPSVARSEAFGIVQLEAMAAGVAVINTQLASSVPFVSVHGVTGLTVPPADSQALAKAINCLLGNSELRARFGEAARCRVKREFDASLMGSRTVELYKEVMAQPLVH